MEVSILFSILDGPGRRGWLILYQIELKAADMGIEAAVAPRLSKIWLMAYKSPQPA